MQTNFFRLTIDIKTFFHFLHSSFSTLLIFHTEHVTYSTKPIHTPFHRQLFMEKFLSARQANMYMTLQLSNERNISFTTNASVDAYNNALHNKVQIKTVDIIVGYISDDLKKNKKSFPDDPANLNTCYTNNPITTSNFIHLLDSQVWSQSTSITHRTPLG